MHTVIWRIHPSLLARLTRYIEWFQNLLNVKIELMVGIQYITGKLNCVANKQLIKARQKNYKKWNMKQDRCRW